MLSSYAIAHVPTNAPTLLQSLLAHAAYPTILLISTTQSQFVRDILFTPSLDNGILSQDRLRPTLHALSIAPHISMVFTPTLSHLRAWLTVADRSCFAPAAPSTPFATWKTNHNDMEDIRETSKQRGRLVVWNLVTSSCHTSEWSVQGLSETLAALIDCGHRLNCDIDLVEASEPLAEADPSSEIIAVSEDDIMRNWVEGEEGKDAVAVADEDGNMATEEARARNDIYHRRLPMLNGSSRRVGLNESAAWSGRTVEVGVVLRKWFKFAGDNG